MPIEHRYTDTTACVRHLADVLGSDLRIAAPLGLGKPHGLLNALYRMVGKDKTRSMRLYTALSLTRPQPAAGLEQRFLQPFLERHFGSDAVDPQYALDQARDALPANVEVHEFYLQSGAMLNSASAQRSYISQNYTHVARDLVVQDINLLVQLVARREGPDGVHYSLSCNPDLTLDLLRLTQLADKPRPLCVAVVHPDLPYMGGDAEVAEAFFDVELQPEHSPPLFALPRAPVDLVEYALGLHASALVQDDGCLQIGIGALSDALVKALLLRHQNNIQWRRALVALDPLGKTHALAGWLGGLAAFEKGLYGASEMVMDGFMHLQRGGILKRRSWDSLALERAAVAGRIDHRTSGGHYLRGAFFLGSRELYQWLADTEAADPDAIDMCAVSHVNQLYGMHQSLSMLQRRGARFFNTCMMATALGAAVSDTLEDGSVVSGVGGQYNFVAMAHELPDARSVLLLRSTRSSGGGIESNIRWNYGETTIPRHLRDIIITEYGIADLRGKSDSECIEAMLGITDARFLDALCAEAKAHGKLAANFVIPESWRLHRPRHLHKALAPFRQHGLLPKFPFGSDFNEIEQRLLPALEWLKYVSANWRGKLGLLVAACRRGELAPGESAALARMGLSAPISLADRWQRRLLQVALRRQVPNP
ncbi:acetyl-CoA hydrolase/transferase C-terminal domain-containing protein [Rhodanobacter sp. AS-Z3]|uniref:acetyl-CoA hydrolase/transferase C-terminal domain-containing protein n=1 Tax=Rhodanobacter sp. AS-Z3 TaxID=3031330 RepID=UPI00247A47AF|nr:acetyl-CoA hydrolase/transferase C-terminal domain-containing protein [Rhodanobacter sp. AS-Z3]WEN13929.1 acetyl-CoA hydrolase/transferase C-terminal domain-containing protein [Rhodanobacter sp. AS-Z3]